MGGTLASQVKEARVDRAMYLLAAVPNPGPIEHPGMGGPAGQMLGWLKWVGLVAGMGGLGMWSIMMILGRRNRSNMAVDGATGIPWVLGGLSLMSLASGLVGAVLSCPVEPMTGGTISMAQLTYRKPARARLAIVVVV